MVLVIDSGAVIALIVFHNNFLLSAPLVCQCIERVPNQWWQEIEQWFG
jgi:hypothetical protein